MTIDIHRHPGSRSLPHRLAAWLCRASAIAMFALGLLYWVRLVGVFDGALWRFDLMPLPWRMATPALAVLYPIAGVGLWMPVSWGVVVWVAVALIEAFMAFALPAGLAAHPAILIGHAAALLVLAALHLTARIRGRRDDRV